MQARITQLESMIKQVQTARPASQLPHTTTATEKVSGTPFTQTLHHAQQVQPSTAPSATHPTSRAHINQLVDKLSQHHGVNKHLVNALVKQESGFNPTVTSPAGAQGLMQLMPATAKELGVTNTMDPAQNLDGGIRYLKQKLTQYHGNIPLALAAYNAGSGAVAKYNGIPPYKETQHYVRTVLANYMQANGNSATQAS